MSETTITAYRYRLFPTKAQEAALTHTLEVCRQVYNSLLNWHEHDYAVLGKSPSKFDQQAAFPLWKKDHAELSGVFSQVLQNVAVRVDLAYKAFFRRVKDGETPGFPRIKGKGQYDSITYPQAGFGFYQGKLRLSKIGDVSIRLHRPIDGTIKTCTIRRVNSKWFVCFSAETEALLLPPSSEEVGVVVENPRFFRKDEKALAKAGRKQAKTKKRSRERRKANKVLARIHERIRNRRHDFVHQTARRLVNRFGVIAVEKLNVKGMVKNHCLAKSISDASWSMFRSILVQKAESAVNRIVVEVNPRYTSQMCSRCGNIQKKSLSVRWHECQKCGLSLDRDMNAAINIAALGQQCLPALTG